MQFPNLALDLPDFTDGSPTHLVRANNVYPATVGYRPFKGLSSATGALPAAWVGGGAFEYNGTSAMLGATAAALYSHASGAWTSEKSVSTSQPWYFVQFGDLVIGFNGGAPVKFTLSTGVAADLGGSPPSASYGAVVRDFVMTAGNGSEAQTVSWCEINDAEGWSFGTNQSDQQLIPDGGPITGIAGGEYGLVFQRDQITQFDYVGADPYFIRRTISREAGAVAHGGIAQYGRTCFFLSRRGFYALTEGQLKQIGRNAVDQAFLGSYTSSDLETYLRCAIDPERELAIWSMPDKLWIYHWGEEKWSTVEISGLVGISSGITASATLEEIAVIYPSIEDVTPSLDDAYWRGGIPLLLLFKTDKIGYTFSSGDNLEATFRLCKIEPAKGRTANLINTTPITDAVSGITISDDVSFRQGDAPSTKTSADLRASGNVPIRATGQYHQVKMVIAAGTTWTYASGIELEGSPGGWL